MIIKNIPSSLMSVIKNSNCTFSDDSRFIYFSHPNNIIVIYDNKFNEYITLKADAAIIEYRQQLKGFSSFTDKPFIHFVNQNTVILFWSDISFDYSNNGYSALVMLVRINFSAKTFSMIDKIIYKHCYYPYLLKDGTQYALLHITEVDVPMEEGNECRCFLYEINENGINQTKKDPLIFDYDYHSLSHRPGEMHLHDNKIWYFRDARRWQDIPPGQSSIFLQQLSYFDLNDAIPIKETTVEILYKTGESYYSGGFLIYFPNQFEYEMLNLHTKSWSNGRNNMELQKHNITDSNLACFSTKYCESGTYNIDLNFNVIAVDKITKELFLVPLKNPQSLYDIAWTAALNAGLLNQKDESKLPKNLKYQKLF